jgi:hypothetical protein
MKSTRKMDFSIAETVADSLAKLSGEEQKAIIKATDKIAGEK